MEAGSRRARRPHRSLRSVLKAVGAAAGLSGGRSKSHNAPGATVWGRLSRPTPGRCRPRRGEDAARHPVSSAHCGWPGSQRPDAAAQLYVGRGGWGSGGGGVLPDLLRGLKVKSQPKLFNKQPGDMRREPALGCTTQAGY